MDEKDVARLLGLTRVGVGAALLLAPRRLARLWGARGEDSVAMSLALRSLGGRDAALGVGLLVALERDGAVHDWLQAGVVADASDALGALTASGELSGLRRLLFVGGGMGAAALGVRLARELGESQ